VVVLLHGLCMNDLLSKRKGLEAPLDRQKGATCR